MNGSQRLPSRWEPLGLRRIPNGSQRLLQLPSSSSAFGGTEGRSLPVSPLQLQPQTRHPTPHPPLRDSLTNAHPPPPSPPPPPLVPATPLASAGGLTHSAAAMLFCSRHFTSMRVSTTILQQRPPVSSIYLPKPIRPLSPYLLPSHPYPLSLIPKPSPLAPNPSSLCLPRPFAPSLNPKP